MTYAVVFAINIKNKQTNNNNKTTKNCLLVYFSLRMLGAGLCTIIGNAGYFTIHR